MKKLVNAGLKSKKEAAQALIDGRVFYLNGHLIEFNENRETPFRHDYTHLIGGWGGYQDWQEEKQIPWYEDIPGYGVICWVSCQYKGEKTCIDVIHNHNGPVSENPFVGKRCNWKYAEPVKPEELYSGGE